MKSKLVSRALLPVLFGAAIAAAGCSSASGSEPGAQSQPTDTAAAPEAVTQATGADGGAARGDHHGFGHGHHHRDLEGFFKRWDKDGDGKVALADLPEGMRDHLKSADTNGDGYLTRDEMKAAHEAMRAKMKAMIDTNGDGTVSPDERAAAREKFRGMWFKHLDANGDGVLTESEVGAKRWEHLKAADTNGDGKIDATEMAAFKPHQWNRGAPDEATPSPDNANQ